MGSPGIIFLADTYGKRSGEHGFVLCPLYGRKSKAFQAASSTSTSVIISNLTKTAKTMVGVSLHVDSTQLLAAAEFIKQRVRDAFGADGIPLWGVGQSQTQNRCSWDCKYSEFRFRNRATRRTWRAW